jgi:Arc/MetJ-type ribon-helix-helix transcriptional regulator
MTSELHLTPHLESFVRAQLQTGRFRSRDDVISAALALLEGQFHSSEIPKTWSKHASSTFQDPEHSTTAVNQDSQPNGDQFPSRTSPGSDKTADSAPRRSPRGLLADLPSHLGPDDFKDARGEVWSRFQDDQAG